MSSDICLRVPLGHGAATKLLQNVWKDALVAVDNGQRGKYAPIFFFLASAPPTSSWFSPPRLSKVMGLGYALLRGERGHLYVQAHAAHSTGSFDARIVTVPTPEETYNVSSVPSYGRPPVTLHIRLWHLI